MKTFSTAQNFCNCVHTLIWVVYSKGVLILAFLKGGPSFLCVDHFTKTRVGVGLKKNTVSPVLSPNLGYG